MRSVLECCISHITADDNTLLTELCREKFEGEWIMDTGVGYLIRLDASEALWFIPRRTLADCLVYETSGYQHDPLLTGRG